MCAPVAPAIVLGVATAVTGAVSSISQYSQAQAEAANQNAIQQRQYEIQMQAFQQREAAANRQIELNQQAASKAYMAEQNKIQAKYQKAALEADNLRLKSMQDAAKIQSSGKAGRSIGILAMDPNREYGRDLAVLGLNLGFANADYMQSVDTIFDQATTANNQVASSRSAAPAKPTKVRGPGSLGLIAGIASAGIGGFQTYSSLKAPSGYVNRPPNASNGSPWPSAPPRI